MPETDLVRLLGSIGKSTFVRYFDDFRNLNLSNKEVIERLPSEYTLKSRTTRTSKSRRIFREGLAADALKIIASSDFVDADTANSALRILATISNGASSITLQDDE